MIVPKVEENCQWIDEIVRVILVSSYSFVFIDQINPEEVNGFDRFTRDSSCPSSTVSYYVDVSL